MIKDIDYLFKNLIVVKSEEYKGNILILNSETYDKFHEQFKDYNGELDE